MPHLAAHSPAAQHAPRLRHAVHSVRTGLRRNGGRHAGGHQADRGEHAAVRAGQLRLRRAQVGRSDGDGRAIRSGADQGGVHGAERGLRGLPHHGVRAQVRHAEAHQGGRHLRAERALEDGGGAGREPAARDQAPDRGEEGEAVRDRRDGGGAEGGSASAHQHGDAGGVLQAVEGAARGPGH